MEVTSGGEWVPHVGFHLLDWKAESVRGFMVKTILHEFT